MIRLQQTGTINTSRTERTVSEVHFFMQARFPGADLSGRFFRAVYSHGGQRDTTGAAEELAAIGVDVAAFLDPDLSWEIEDCGVDERDCLHLKANTSGESSQVIGALCVAAHALGAGQAEVVRGANQVGNRDAEPIHFRRLFA